MKAAIRRWLGITEAAPAPAAARPLTVSDHTLSLFSRPPADLDRRRLALPQLPPGVRPADAPEMAMDDAGSNFQQSMAWCNSLGISGGLGLYFPGYPYLSELAQRSEYRAATETISDEMTRKWIKFKSKGDGDKSVKIGEIEDRFNDLDVQGVFRRVEMQDGFFGRSQIYIDLGVSVKDRNLPLVIDPNGIQKGSLRAFKVIEPMWTTPVAWNSIDPTANDFYRPTMWYVLGIPTNANRLMTFISREVPDILKPSYNFGGVSLSQLMEPYVNQWLRTRDSVSDLIHNFSVLALMTDMESALANGADSSLFQRTQLFNQCRDNRGLMLLNKNTEELALVQTSLGGLHELQAQSQEHMCAPSHIPLIKLTGVTPSGLNASSEGEIQVWYDHIRARQETIYTKHLNMVLDIVQLDLYGVIDPDISYEYVPLMEPDGEALARQRKTDGEAGVGYIAAGVISADEERERLASDPLSGYENLDGPAPEAPPPGMVGNEPKEDDEGDGDNN